MDFVVAIGRLALSVWNYLARFAALLRRTLSGSLGIGRHNLPTVLRITMMQIFFTGFQAVIPVTVAAVAIGILVLTVALQYLPVDYVQGVASLVIVREVVPLILAFLIIGRSGTAITIEIGHMQLHDELRALEVMGIPIEQYVMLPRLVGCVVAFLMLQIYADLFGLIGGYYGSAMIDMHLPAYPVADLLSGIEPSDFVLACVKATLFGTVVSITAMQHGMEVTHSAREIPIATSRAVVRSLLLCLLLNTVISVSA